MCVLLITWLLRLVGRLSTGIPVNHTSWMAVVTPPDRPKSVCNRCVIAVFGGVLGWWIFCWYEDFCHRTKSDLVLFLFITNVTTVKCNVLFAKQNNMMAHGEIDLVYGRSELCHFSSFNSLTKTNKVELELQAPASMVYHKHLDSEAFRYMYMPCYMAKLPPLR